MGNYVYRFMDKDNNIIYIGRTHDMYSRMCGHYTENGASSILPDMNEVSGIYYFNAKTFSDSIVYEAYLVAKYKPKYNKEFNADDGLTLRLADENIEWSAYSLNRDDNPNHVYRIFKDGILLYEFPKVHELYDPLAKKLGLTIGMNIPYGSHLKDGKYEVNRISSKRRVRNGTMLQKPKYDYGKDFQFKLEV